MTTLADVFREINELKAAGLVRDYAIGGERAWQMLDAGAVDRQRLRTLLRDHGMEIAIDDGP